MPALFEPEEALLDSDPRWGLAQRVVAGPHFARSKLLASFLLYVVSETLAGRQEALSEHKIGVAVFGRPASYRTDDDNIVRNYARQLRKRLAEYFADIGSAEPIRISIPVGGYTPSFVSVSHFDENGSVRLMPEDSQPFADSDTGAAPGVESPPMDAKRRTISAPLSVALLGLAFLAGSAFPLMKYRVFRHPEKDVSHLLWRSILSGPEDTLIVPPDAGFNLMEDLSQQAYPLTSYMSGTFAAALDKRISRHAAEDLRSQQYTDFVSMQIAVAIARLPEFNPQRVFFRFPRQLQVNDLKTNNVLIIGSPSSNPWAGLIDANANFHFVTSPDMESERIVNTKPLPGEARVYESHWNEPAHDTYALILFLPNLSASGHVLVIEGLDVAGTQAAAELLLHPQPIAPILRAARQPDGSLRPFEILLRTTSIESSAAGTEIIASRVH